MIAFKHQYLSESQLLISREAKAEMMENNYGSFMLSVYCVFLQVLLIYFNYESATLVVMLQEWNS